MVINYVIILFAIIATVISTEKADKDAKGTKEKVEATEKGSDELSGATVALE